MKTSALKVIFAGTPEFAATHLQAIIDSKHQICAVYTQPDRPAGRGRKISESPVKALALANNIEVCQPESLKTEAAQQQLQAFGADIMVVVAYGLILPLNILNTPSLGCINVHGSLLPRWRGAAPIQRAIEAGDIEAGVTIMQMDEGLDTGDMLIKSSLKLDAKETSSTLYDRLMTSGAETLIKALNLIALGEVTPIKQDNSKASYAKKLTKLEAAVDWSLSAEALDRKIRAFTPWPGSYVSQNGDKLKIIAKPLIDNSSSETLGKIIKADKNGLVVACKKDFLLITSLQLPGKKMTPVSALLNAYDRFNVGQQFDL